MTPRTLACAALLAAAALATPAAAHAPGNVSHTFEEHTLAVLDLKGGAGLEDSDPTSICSIAHLGSQRQTIPFGQTWEADQNLGANLDGPAFGVSDLAPPLGPVPGHPGQGGLHLGSCPTYGSASDVWLAWSGMNWYTDEEDSVAEVDLCTAMVFASSSPGCLPVADANLKLYASACQDALAATFTADYTDAKGKEFNGLPFDTLGAKSDAVACTVRHSHDYTATVDSFQSGAATQRVNFIKNADVVHPGAGSTYVAVCWQIDYADFTNPLAPVTRTASAHDWKLILDTEDATAHLLAALQNHYGPGPNAGGAGGPTNALQGFYSTSPGAAGQNGFGPCTTPGPADGAKPAPLL